MFRLMLVLVCLSPALSAAQLTPDQVLSVRDVRDVHLSPDGSHVAFTVHEPPGKTGSATDIWLGETRSGNMGRLTHTESSSSAQWSPDGKRLAFQSSRAEESQIFVVPAAGGTPVPLSSHAGGIESFVWSPDGKSIAFLAPEVSPDTAKTSDPISVVVVSGSDVVSRLWVLDVETKVERRVTTGPYHVSNVSWKPDSSGFLVTASPQGNNPERWTDRIYTVTLSDGTFSEVAAPKGPIERAQLSPDGTTVAYVGARVDGPIGHDLYTVPVSGGTPKNLTAGPVDRPVTQFAWQGKHDLEVMFENGFTNRLYTVTANGRATAVVGFDVNTISYDRAPSGATAYVRESADELPEVWFRAKRSAPRQLTNLNAQWKTVPLVKAELVRYPSFDGTEIEGQLLKPAGAAGRAPTIVLLHQGPVGRWSDRFDGEGQLLVSHGYAVFYPNVRGSTGYGQHLLDLLRSQARGGSGWATGPYKDVMAAVDELVRRGVADPGRLGIGGWSYGGYLTGFAVTQTDRFKAAVAGAGVYDLFNDLGTEIAAYVPGDEWVYGPFYEDSGRVSLQQDSPVTYVKNAHTPILLFHGEHDPVDTIGQTYAFYRALRQYGTTTQFLVYPREGHELAEREHWVDRLNRTVLWYDRYVKGGSR